MNLQRQDNSTQKASIFLCYIFHHHPFTVTGTTISIRKEEEKKNQLNLLNHVTPLSSTVTVLPFLNETSFYQNSIETTLQSRVQYG